MNWRSFSWVWFGAILAVAVAGCHKRQATSAVDEPPFVGVTLPVEREVTDYVDMTGQTEAPQSVDIRPRVTGYLVAMPFQEGAEVKANQMLFQIDPRPYDAQLAKAKATVAGDEAKLKLATANNVRAKQLYARDQQAITEQDRDQYQMTQDDTAATLDAARAAMADSQLNVDFTKVLSPIDGKVSRYYLTLGNLATQDTTLLTTVVSQDPMYVYFDLDEPTVLRIVRRLRQSGEVATTLADHKVPVYRGLVDEQGYPHKGYLDFANNQVDTSTGTISVRGVFANPSSPTGVRLLRPGMFTRVRLPLDKPYKALLVPDRALCSDQGEKYLLIANGEDVVEYRRIKAGALQEDGLRVISEGVRAGEKVIVSGLQMVRPRMKVQPELVKAASGKPEAASQASSSGKAPDKPEAKEKSR
jgi:multidrug efflux system membrane fusion protein